MRLNNKYEFNPQTDLLGKGGFGKVYKARDNVLHLQVALKLADKNNLPEKYSLVAEIGRVLHLHHNHLVKYRDAFIHKAAGTFGEETEVQVGVMEYINGGDLKQYCGRPHAIPNLQEVLTGILDGLSYLHRNGIIHRDIKPQNILLHKAAGQLIPKISDFGISKNIGDAGCTVSGIVGSQAYMAPEQLNNTGGKLSAATDIWAFGVLLYELLTGERPFDQPGVTSNAEVITNIVECRLPHKVNTLPQPYQSVIKSCLKRGEGARVQSANEVLALIRKVGSSERNKVIVSCHMCKHKMKIPGDKKIKFKCKCGLELIADNGKVITENKLGDIFIKTNIKKFPSDKIPAINEKIKQASEDQVNLLYATKFKRPINTVLTALLVGGLGIDRFSTGSPYIGSLKIGLMIIAQMMAFIGDELGDLFPFYVFFLFGTVAFHITEVITATKRTRRYNYLRLNELMG